MPNYRDVGSRSLVRTYLVIYNNNNNNNSLFQTLVYIHNKNIIIKNTYIQSINKYIAVKK